MSYNQDLGAGNTKFDADKPRPELLPATALLEVVKVLTKGAEKYDDNNWREGEGSSTQRYLGALMRHVFAYSQGEDKDPETGLSHMAHAACNALFLLEAEIFGLWNDDRVRVAGRPRAYTAEPLPYPDGLEWSEEDKAEIWREVAARTLQDVVAVVSADHRPIEEGDAVVFYNRGAGSDGVLWDPPSEDPYEPLTAEELVSFDDLDSQISASADLLSDLEG